MPNTPRISRTSSYQVGRTRSGFSANTQDVTQSLPPGGMLYRVRSTVVSSKLNRSPNPQSASSFKGSSPAPGVGEQFDDGEEKPDKAVRKRLRVFARVRPVREGEFDGKEGHKEAVDVLRIPQGSGAFSTPAKQVGTMSGTASQAGDAASPLSLGAADEESFFDPSQASDVPASYVRVAGKDFQFDRVFEGCHGNKDVYVECVEPIVEHVMEGFNGAVMCYGQTGAGKTHTMSHRPWAHPIRPTRAGGFSRSMGAQGSSNALKRCTSDMSSVCSSVAPETTDDGVVFQAVRQLFQKIRIAQAECSKTKFTVRCTYVQLYRDHLQDLLDPDTPYLTLHHKNQLETGEDELAAQQTPPLNNFEEFYSWYISGDRHRVVAETKMNKSSSRGHSIITLFVRQAFPGRNPESPRGYAPPRDCRSRLVFVDLAGYERLSQVDMSSQLSGGGGPAHGSSSHLVQTAQDFEIRRDEARHINLSLSALAHVIQSITFDMKHIPWRNSNLTRVLRPSLSGNSVTTIILNVSPNSRDVTETINTLHFGHNAIQCKGGSVHVNLAEIDYKTEYSKVMRAMGDLKRQNSSLQTQLTEARSSYAGSPTSTDWGPYPPLSGSPMGTASAHTMTEIETAPSALQMHAGDTSSEHGIVIDRSISQVSAQQEELELQLREERERCQELEEKLKAFKNVVTNLETERDMLSRRHQPYKPALNGNSNHSGPAAGGAGKPHSPRAVKASPVKRRKDEVSPARRDTATHYPAIFRPSNSRDAFNEVESIGGSEYESPAVAGPSQFHRTDDLSVVNTRGGTGTPNTPTSPLRKTSSSVETPNQPQQQTTPGPTPPTTNVIIPRLTNMHLVSSNMNPEDRGLSSRRSVEMWFAEGNAAVPDVASLANAVCASDTGESKGEEERTAEEEEEREGDGVLSPAPTPALPCLNLTRRSSGSLNNTQRTLSDRLMATLRASEGVPSPIHAQEELCVVVEEDGSDMMIPCGGTHSAAEDHHHDESPGHSPRNRWRDYDHHDVGATEGAGGGLCWSPRTDNAFQEALSPRTQARRQYYMHNLTIVTFLAVYLYGVFH